MPPRASARARCSTARNRLRSVASARPVAQIVRPLDLVVEGQHGEPVGGGERVDHPGRGPPGGHHLPAAHAAGAVEQQHHVLRARRRRCRRAAAPPAGRRPRARRRSRPARRPRSGRRPRTPAQDEVAVGPLARLDAAACRRASVTVCRLDRTSPSVQPGRVDVDADRQPQRVGEAGQQHRRGDARGVRHRVGVRRLPVARRTGPAAARRGCSAARRPAGSGRSPRRPRTAAGRPGSARPTTRSPGRMLPTRMVNTSGRSSSAIEARCPAAIAWSYASRAAPRSCSSASTVRPSAVIVMPVTAARSGSGKT